MNLNFRKLLSKGFYGQKINSGEEFDYKNVENGGHYNLNSFNRSGMFVLPPNPEQGTTIYFADGEASTRWFPVKIHRNGNPIMGVDDHMICDVPNATTSPVVIVLTCAVVSAAKSFVSTAEA